MKESLYILDSHNFFYRALYAPMAPLSHPCPCRGNPECPRCEGSGEEPTKVAYLFAKEFLRIASQHHPTHWAAVFDGPRSALRRREIYGEYKTNREERGPDEMIRAQMRMAKEVLAAMGVPLLQCQGHEADDAIAALCRESPHGCSVSILSRDKDFVQLINPRVSVQDPKSGKWYGEDNAVEWLGVKPGQVVDLLCLTGDSSDNIPGVGKVGEKTAAKLLREYGSLERIVRAARMGFVGGKVGENILRAHRTGWLETARRLVTLDAEVPLGISFMDLQRREFDRREMSRAFAALDFRSLA